MKGFIVMLHVYNNHNMMTVAMDALDNGVDATASFNIYSALSFAFSLFSFFASFCLSVYVLDFGLKIWTLAKQVKSRPYSPTFLKIERQLQSACASEDSEIWCLRNKRLSVYEFKDLVLPLLSDPQVKRWRSLHLENNDFGDVGCDLLFKSLIDKTCVCKLEFLSLKQCGINQLPKSLRQYIRQDATSLRSIDLSGNDLDDTQILRLATSLAHSELRMVDLSRNKLSAESLVVLGDAVANSKVEDVRIRGNFFRDEGIQAFVNKALVQRSPLKHLDVSDNIITDEGVLAIAQMMPASGLQELNLMDNRRITDASMLVLAKSLQSLRVLNISKLRRVTDTTVDALIERAKHSLLKRIVWFGINLTPKCEKRLTKMLHLVGSRSFYIIVTLCSAIDVHRLGERSSLRMLPKDIIRSIVECMLPRT